jgi:ribosomal protein L31
MKIAYEYICDCGRVHFVDDFPKDDTVKQCDCGRRYMDTKDTYNMIDVTNSNHPYWKEEPFYILPISERFN